MKLLIALLVASVDAAYLRKGGKAEPSRCPVPLTVRGTRGSGASRVTAAITTTTALGATAARQNAANMHWE